MPERDAGKKAEIPKHLRLHLKQARHVTSLAANSVLQPWRRSYAETIGNKGAADVDGMLVAVEASVSAGQGPSAARYVPRAGVDLSDEWPRSLVEYGRRRRSYLRYSPALPFCPIEDSFLPFSTTRTGLYDKVARISLASFAPRKS
jgi:hypothetical protein